MKGVREGYLELRCKGTDSDGNEFYECDMYFEKRNDTDVHMIEAAPVLAEFDRLVEALETCEMLIAGFCSIGIGGAPNGSDTVASRAIDQHRAFRGEKDGEG